jgi:hypothetical protein
MGIAVAAAVGVCLQQVGMVICLLVGGFLLQLLRRYYCCCLDYVLAVVELRQTLATVDCWNHCLLAAAVASNIDQSPPQLASLAPHLLAHHSLLLPMVLPLVLPLVLPTAQLLG